MANYLNVTTDFNVIGDWLSSKYYWLVRLLRCYNNLQGWSWKPNMGISWDEAHSYFKADEKHWEYLIIVWLKTHRVKFS